MTKPRSGTTQTVCLSLYADELEALLRYAPEPTGDRRTRSGATAAVRRLLAIAREAETRRG